MLSVQKIKLHGMKDSKWETKDKITQYKGLNKLFKRDRKVLNADLNVTRKKINFQIDSIKTKLQLNRSAFDNVIYGDKQAVGCVFAEKEEMKLAYGDLELKKIIECVSQKTFLQRKQLDMINFKMKQRKQRLQDLRLELAELEDREQLMSTKSKLKLDCEIISGKIQDMILKKDAAIAVRNSFINIIDIMKNDEHYMYSVIGTLEQDSRKQWNCMNQAVQLGQLATEYLDDRRDEFRLLENCVRREMNMRKQNLEEVRQRVKDIKTNLKALNRKESDINLAHRTMKFEDTNTLLISIESMEKDLESLMNTLLLTKFDNIYPCLITQHDIKCRLQTMVKNSEKSKEQLMNKVTHAYQMKYTLKYTVVENTFEYTKNKIKILSVIDNTKKSIKDVLDLIQNKSKLYLQIRTNLQRLVEICLPISEGKKPKMVRTASESLVEESFPSCEKDIMKTLYTKLNILMNSARKQEFTSEEVAASCNNYEQLLRLRCYLYVAPDVLEESLVEGVRLEDANVLTRQNIKDQSTAIVVANSVDPDMVPQEQPRRKRKFKF